MSKPTVSRWFAATVEPADEQSDVESSNQPATTATDAITADSAASDATAADVANLSIAEQFRSTVELLVAAQYEPTAQHESAAAYAIDDPVVASSLADFDGIAADAACSAVQSSTKPRSAERFRPLAGLATSALVKSVADADWPATKSVEHL